MTLHHPWLTFVSPFEHYTLEGTEIKLYSIAYTSLPRLRGDVMILPADQTLRMVKGLRKMVRDVAGENLIEEEAVQYAPLAPGEAVVTSAGRMRVRHIVHMNIFEQTQITHPEIQARAFEAAFRRVTELDAQVIVIPDYTPDLMRALAEDTAYTILEAIRHHKHLFWDVRLVCFDRVHAWVFAHILERVSHHDDPSPDPNTLRVRHTMLYVVHEATPLKLPGDAIFHATDTRLSFDERGIAEGTTPERAPIGVWLEHRGGRELVEGTMRLAPIRLGDATYTRGGKLPYPWVIHLAVREFHQLGTQEVLQAAVRSGLAVADAQRMKTLVVPNPAIGHTDLTVEESAQTVVETIVDYLYTNTSHLARILLVATSEQEEKAWRQVIDTLRPRLQVPALAASE